VSVFGCIEAGGTKFVCGIGTGPEDLRLKTIPTTSPDETTARVVEYFRQEAGGELQAVGIGAFGPIDVDPASPTFGYITSTPKPGWQNYPLAGNVGRGLGVPVEIDTDVNAAAYGEAQWGAAQGLSDFLYLTVGTGVGGGAMVHDSVIHGMMHPEMGHIRLPHDREHDPFNGICPYHGDCLEGLASGPAIQARWGAPGQSLPPDHPAWVLEAHYLALGLATWVCTLSPKRIVLGGGVMEQRQMFPLIHRELGQILNGYIHTTAIIDEMDRYVVPPYLANRSGVLGALVLAERSRNRTLTRAW
jgi:fructokinase